MIKDNLSFKIFKDIDSEIEKIWQILEKNSSYYFFQNLEYVKTLSKYSKDKELITVIIFKNNKPIMIFPLEIKKIFSVKFLQWAGTSESDYCGPIISDYTIEKDNFLDLWQKIINEIKDYDIIFFDKQPENIEKNINPFFKYFNNISHSKIYQIKIENDEQDYIDKLSNKKFVTEFLRTKKKLLSTNEVEFEHNLAFESKLEPEKIIKKKISSLNEKKINHNLEGDFTNFYITLIDSNFKNIYVSTLKINKQLVAANLGIIEKRRFYYYIPVIFNEKFNNFSPGKLLINELINWSKKKEVDFFDFGIGQENYKKYWSNSSVNLYRYINFRGIKGFFIYLLVKIYIKLKQSF